ncbi:MAG: hypothetical protein A2808_02215 [Candidatus Moranbacteria bacterium RIFCSPHIGHO2_01_FULL_55_24]|nr:MAG: hypothetical protein A2808_02215 [Candidatus Moranbacteria bacterium RIFCSPHIGHO2_01_FULL_55_24]
MQKKVTVILGSVVSLAVLAAGGFFLFSGARQGKALVYENTSGGLETEVAEAEDSGAEEEKALPAEAVESVSKKDEAKTEESAPPSVEENVKETQPASRNGAKPSITDRLMHSGFSSKSGRSIDTIVLHSSYDALGNDPYSVSGLIKEYEEYGVSAHYLVDRKGNIYRLVKEENVSYHAGVSKMSDGRTDVNGFSLGIELMNQMDGNYTDAQYQAVNRLVAWLKSEYPIRHVVGHDDIAPDRKSDPWNFDWKKLKK